MMKRKEADAVKRHIQEIAEEMLVSLDHNIGFCIGSLDEEQLTALDLQSALADALDNLETG